MQEDSRFKKYNTILNVFLITTLFLSIGYAQIIADPLNVDGTATAYEQEGVYVSNVSYVSSNYTDTIESYTKQRVASTINSKIVFDRNQDATITYQIEVTNGTDKPYIYIGPSVSENFYSNSNIEYNVSGLNQGDIINPNDTKTFNLTYNYKDNIDISSTSTELNAYITFGFRQIYTITYTNISGSGYPSYVVKWKANDNQNPTLNVDFGSNAPNEIHVMGTETSTEYVLGTNYTYTSGVLNFPNVTENLEIIGSTPSHIIDSGFYDYTVLLNSADGEYNYPNAPGKPKAVVENGKIVSFTLTEPGNGVTIPLSNGDILKTGVNAFNNNNFTVHLKYRMNSGDNSGKYILTAMTKAQGNNKYSGLAFYCHSATIFYLNAGNNTSITTASFGSRVSTDGFRTEAGVKEYTLDFTYTSNGGGNANVNLTNTPVTTGTDNYNGTSNYFPRQSNDAVLTIGGIGISGFENRNATLEILELTITRN